MLTARQLRSPALLSSLAALLALPAAAGGLLIRGLYEPFMPTTLHLVGAYAQDLVTVLVAGLLLLAITRALSGSLRALLLWTGCLTDLLYSYLLWSFDVIYTIFFPNYLAIVSLSLFSLLYLLGKIDPVAFASRISAEMSGRAIAMVLGIPAFMLPPWLAFAVQGARNGEPAAINTVLVLDLGFLIPACLLAAVLVWRKHPRGLIFAAPLLVKMITTGSALTISTIWSRTRGVSLDPVLPVYLLMVLAGSITLARYLRHVAAGFRPAMEPG